MEDERIELTEEVEEETPGADSGLNEKIDQLIGAIERLNARLKMAEERKSEKKGMREI